MKSRESATWCCNPQHGVEGAIKKAHTWCCERERKRLGGAERMQHGVATFNMVLRGVERTHTWCVR